MENDYWACICESSKEFRMTDGQPVFFVLGTVNSRSTEGSGEVECLWWVTLRRETSETPYKRPARRRKHHVSDYSALNRRHVHRQDQILNMRLANDILSALRHSESKHCGLSRVQVEVVLSNQYYDHMIRIKTLQQVGCWSRFENASRRVRVC